MGTPGTRTKPGSLSTRTRPSSHRYSGQRTARRGGLTDHRVVRPLHLQLQRMHVNSGGEVVQREGGGGPPPRTLRGDSAPTCLRRISQCLAHLAGPGLLPQTRPRRAVPGRPTEGRALVGGGEEQQVQGSTPGGLHCLRRVQVPVGAEWSGGERRVQLQPRRHLSLDTDGQHGRP